MRNFVFILGAGASAHAGATVMRDFLDVRMVSKILFGQNPLAGRVLCKNSADEATRVLRNNYERQDTITVHAANGSKRYS